MKIRYYGHAGQVTGYGRAAEHMITALVRAGAEVEIRTLAPYNTLSWDTHNLPLASLLRRDDQLDPNPDVVIVHTLPMDCPKVYALEAPTLNYAHRRPLWIAYTTWETYKNAPMEVVAPYTVFDHVWHPSEQSASCFDPLIDLPNAPTVSVMPHCYDEHRMDFYRERRSAPLEVPLDQGRRFRFYTLGAFTARKNPLAIIRAFAHAFSKADNVELLMACQGMTRQQLTHAICSTGFAPDDLPPIRSDFRPLTEAEVWDLHRGADAFVTATRGEAWNLPAFEAMLAGRHVIAPRGLGHDAFLRNTSAFRYFSYPAPALVDTRATPNPSGGGTIIQTIGAQGLTSKSLWREPNVLELAEGMRQAYKERRSSIFVEYDIPGRFGYAAVGKLAIEFIEYNIRERKPKEST